MSVRLWSVADGSEPPPGVTDSACAVDERAHQPDRLVIAEPLLADQRPPGGECDGVTECRPRPSSRVPAERPTGQERVLGHPQVVAERTKALANERQFPVAKEVLEHLGGSAVEGIELAERDRQT